MASPRKPVKFFISYAHGDGKYKDDLLERLKPFLGASKRYDYQIWDDGLIRLGEKWEKEIIAALNECDFGLLFVSPNFLNSRFIAEVELVRFVGDKAPKPVLPVALGRLLFDLMNLKGLEKYQIFRHKEKCYAQCGSGKQRDDFVQELFENIEERLNRHFGRGR